MAKGQAGGQGQGGQQKQLSPVIKLVLEYNPDDIAKWRESCVVTEDSYENLVGKRRDEVTRDMKPGQKAFSNAAQTLINLVSADPDAGLSGSDLEALKTDVFDKTAKAIAEAEKKKAEEKGEAEKRKKAEDHKKAAEWTFQNPDPIVHSIAEYTASMLTGQGQRVARIFAEFEANLSDTEATAFQQKLTEGVPKRKLATLVRTEDLAGRKVQAKAMDLI